jgi:hypothetical protein
MEISEEIIRQYETQVEALISALNLRDLALVDNHNEYDTMVPLQCVWSERRDRWLRSDTWSP